MSSMDVPFVGKLDVEPRKVALPEALTTSTPSFAGASGPFSSLHAPAWVHKNHVDDTKAGVNLPHPLTWLSAMPAATVDLPRTPWCLLPSRYGAFPNFEAPGCPPPSVVSPMRKNPKA